MSHVATSAHRPHPTPTSASPAFGAWLQRKCACEGKAGCEQCRKKQELQRKPLGASTLSGAVPASVGRVLESPGRALDGATRLEFERGFGHDFSRVRIHDDVDAAHSAKDVEAHAYTVGSHVAFAAGRYAPGTPSGRHLLAHELTHVVQQSRGATGASPETASVADAYEREADAMADAVTRGPSPGRGRASNSLPPARVALRRKPEDRKDKPAARTDQPPKPAVAADPPKITVADSTKGAPCACLVVVHNDERNARLTAEQMARNCAYNLAFVGPDNAKRKVTIGSKGGLDPNEFFDRSVATQCTKDEQGCRDFVAAKAGTTDQAELERVVHTGFFLAMSDCSKKFSLPVVALHNNDVEDTKAYMDQKGSKGTAGLKVDIDKSGKDKGKVGLDALKKTLDDRFDKFKKVVRTKKEPKGKQVTTDVRTEMMAVGKTNIYRWCASRDLSHCHVGDPDHPDLVTWTTNRADFDRLAKLDINVALQTDDLAATSEESKRDLSTLFVMLKDIFASDLKVFLEGLAREDAQANSKLAALIRQRAALQSSGAQRVIDEALILSEILEPMLALASNEMRRKDENTKSATKAAQLRFVNVETPGHALDKQTNADRARHYDAIVTVLSALGLHCCGTDPKAAEGAVKKGLET